MKKTFNLIFLLLVTFYANTIYAQEVHLTQVLLPQALSDKDNSTANALLNSDSTPLIAEKTEETLVSKEVFPIKERALSEFELFISGNAPSKISTNITQFGYDLFNIYPSPFTPVKSAPVGPGYIVGPNDEIKVSLWGKVNANWNLTVDRDGNISLPQIGVIGVAGLTFREMKDVIHKEISRYYTGFEMNVSMGILRTMRIYIVGNAENPGAYTVSSLSSLVSALFETGGPSKTGTMRNIQLKRNGETIVHFDMYDFLMKGDNSNDIRLMPEDVIFIPPVGQLAGIAGNVKRPAIYELKDDTKLLELINMGGGLSNTAFKGRVQVQRIEDHQFRTLFEADLLDTDEAEEKNFLLKDGDLVKVFAVAKTDNIVTLTGAVANKGDYAIIPQETRIKDIILKAGGMLYYASGDAELTRIKVTQAGPVTEFIHIDISKALSGDPEHNIVLNNNDYIFVRTVPEWGLNQTVEIRGEVKFPGSYTIKKGETLSSLINRAGGYTDEAYLRGSVFLRDRVKEMQQESLEQMAERLERELFSESSMGVSTALSQEEVSAKKIEIEQKKQFIETIKKIEATGRMAIMLSHLRLLKGSEYDIELEKGDRLFIPKKNSVVNVIGSVMSRGSFVYAEHFDYKDYINMAGGYTKYADKNNTYVLKADGTANKLSTGLFSWNDSKTRWEIAGFDESKEIEPGDSIIVPEKFERIAWMREIKDLTQILYQIAVATAVVIDIQD